MVLLERRLGRRGSDEDILRVEDVVPHELKQAAVKRVISRLRDDVDHAARFSAEFGVVGGLIDIHFLDVVHGRAQNQIIECLVGDGHAVDQVEIVPAALSQNSVTRSGLLQGRPTCAGRRDRHARGQTDEIDEIAALER